MYRLQDHPAIWNLFPLPTRLTCGADLPRLVGVASMRDFQMQRDCFDSRKSFLMWMATRHWSTLLSAVIGSADLVAYTSLLNWVVRGECRKK